MPSSSYNSYLKYTPIGKSALRYNMWVTEYSQPHALSGSSQQSKMYKHFYPKSYSPGDIAIIGRVRDQTDYNNLAIFIRKFHLELMSAPGASNAAGGKQVPLMTLYIQGEGLNVQGLVGSFQAGAKRFNIAPEFRFNFTVIKDAHSKNTDMHPAYSMRQMWTGNFIDEGPVQNGTGDGSSAPGTGVGNAITPGSNIGN